MSVNRDRLPYFIVSLGIGLLLIASGVAVRGSQAQAVEVAVSATQTADAYESPTPTLTPTDTPTLTPSLTPTNTFTPSPGPSPTPTLTLTPSPTPIPAVKATIDTGGYPTPATPPSTAIPTPVDAVKVPDGVVNILLVGSARRPDGTQVQTDTIIVVSVNRKEGTVNMLSIPRDLYVYIPGWTMNRINTAYIHGQAVGWSGGGPGLLKATLLYNFGIVIHYYALVDLSGFQDIVDVIGGVDVPVDCALQGYVLKEPRLRPEDFDKYEDWEAYTHPDSGNWELFTLPVGVHHLDGYMALWYARQRTGSDDFDRARRQQQVLRAILRQGQTLGLLAQIPQLYNEYGDLVETDMGLGNMLQLAPVGAGLDSSRIRSLIITPDYLISWVEPETGAKVFLPNPEALPFLIAQAMEPPADNYVKANLATVEIRNGTATERLDEVAADRLGWEGLLTIPTGVVTDGNTYEKTLIYDFTGSSRSNALLVLQRVLRVADSQVIVQPDPNRVVDYVVILGQDYNTCTYKAQLPIQETPTAAPTPAPAATPTP